MRIGDRLAFDIMFDVVFGDKYEMVSKADNRPLLDAIATSSVRVGVMIQAPELRNRKIDKWLFPSCIAARGRFIAFVNKMLMNKSTEKEQSGRRNVFTILTSAKDPETGEGLRPSEIGAESTTLIVAGMSPCIRDCISKGYTYFSCRRFRYDFNGSDRLFLLCD